MIRLAALLLRVTAVTLFRKIFSTLFSQLPVFLSYVLVLHVRCASTSYELYSSYICDYLRFYWLLRFATYFAKGFVPLTRLPMSINKTCQLIYAIMLLERALRGFD